MNAHSSLTFYEVRIQRLDADRCLALFLDAALPSSSARRLSLEERLACKTVVYIARQDGKIYAETIYRRDTSELYAAPYDFSRTALTLAHRFLNV